MKSKYHYEKHTDQKYVFSDLSPLYQYYSHNENAKEIKYNYQILLHLPKFPYLRAIKSNKFRLRRYNPVRVIKDKMRTRKLHQKKDNRKSSSWNLEENIPLYQYYMNENDNNKQKMYDLKQLSALPKFPFFK